MKISGRVGNISYNTKDFLVHKLNTLVANFTIDFWYIIFHKAEENEKSDHWHVTLFLNHQIETRELDDCFKEIDKNNELPLGMTKMWERISGNGNLEKPLYDYHDKEYLKQKGMERKYHYSPDDFITSDRPTLDQWIWDCLHMGKFSYNKNLIKHYQDAPSIDSATKSLIMNGYVSLDKMCGLHYLQKMLKEC